uniref:ZP domain-containing protein n=1 Tax=Globodera pallida TaxID=36090 RepID=A0A183BYZ8_GLOPA
MRHIYRRFVFVAVLLLALLNQSSDGAFELDNALLGQPNISCHPDTIEMRFRTKRPFTGKIYVQGHYANPDCRVDFSEAGGADHDGRGGIRLHHGSCDMDRKRMVSPSGGTGMEFSTVLVISFHPLFVTKTDRAFHINCLYKEADRNVDAKMDVGDVTPANIQNDMPIPQCHYSIRKDELNGEILKFARVGDLIVHRWECESDQFGMLVHSCFVEDVQGERVPVIDERGCHKDQNLLGDPTYSEALNLAYRESYVFKFRDRVGVRFSCEIKLCMKAEDGCSDITPPNCQDSKGYQEHYQHSRDDPLGVGGGNQSKTATAASNINKRTRRSIRTVDADLISQYVFVLDEPVEGEDEGEDDASIGTSNAAVPVKLRSRLAKDRALLAGSPVCVSPALFAAIVIVVLASFGLASAIVGHRLFQLSRSGGIFCDEAKHSAPSAATLSSPSVLSSPLSSISSIGSSSNPSMIRLPQSLLFNKR